jgi:hypothetical protein
MIIRLLTIFTILSTPLYAAYNGNNTTIIRKELECEEVKIPQNVYLNIQKDFRNSPRDGMTNIFDCDELYDEDNIFIKKSEKVFIMKENPHLDLIPVYKRMDTLVVILLYIILFTIGLKTLKM